MGLLKGEDRLTEVRQRLCSIHWQDARLPGGRQRPLIVREEPGHRLEQAIRRQVLETQALHKPHFLQSLRPYVLLRGRTLPRDHQRPPGITKHFGGGVISGHRYHEVGIFQTWRDVGDERMMLNAKLSTARNEIGLVFGR